jgi:hypothetical protein
MELRVVVQEGMLDQFTHKLMKWITSYISTTYQIWPEGMDLEGALFNVDEDLCRKIVKDVKRRFRRQLKYIEVECW